MSKLLAALGLSTALAAAACLPSATAANAAMAYGGEGVAGSQHALAPVEKAQFFWGGYNYCWYDSAWNGPGWYWCGYPWRHGYGWGGGYGWHGWHGGYGWRGHSGGWDHRGGWDHHGGWGHGGHIWVPHHH